MRIQKLFYTQQADSLCTCGGSRLTYRLLEVIYNPLTRRIILLTVRIVIPYRNKESNFKNNFRNRQNYLNDHRIKHFVNLLEETITKNNVTIFFNARLSIA